MGVWETGMSFSGDRRFDLERRLYGEVCAASRVGVVVDLVHVRVLGDDWATSDALDLVDRMLVLNRDTYASSSGGEAADLAFDLVILVGAVAGTKST